MQLCHSQRKPLRKEENTGLKKKEKKEREKKIRKGKVKRKRKKRKGKENGKDRNNPLTTSWYAKW